MCIYRFHVISSQQSNYYTSSKDADANHYTLKE